MKLGPTEIKHFKFLIEELLYRLKEDDSLLITDLEDEILICAQILGINSDLEQDNNGY